MKERFLLLAAIRVPSLRPSRDADLARRCLLSKQTAPTDPSAVSGSKKRLFFFGFHTNMILLLFPLSFSTAITFSVSVIHGSVSFFFFSSQFFFKLIFSSIPRPHESAGRCSTSARHAVAPLLRPPSTPRLHF